MHTPSPEEVQREKAVHDARKKARLKASKREASKKAKAEKALMKEQKAKAKLKKKNLDMIIANDVANPNIGFNSDDNQTVVLTAQTEQELPILSKAELARKLIALIAKEIG